MLKIILARIRQKQRTIKYPDEPPILPELFRGYPKLDSGKCPDGCCDCVKACPYGALKARNGARGSGLGENGMALDMGLCIFCQECSSACPNDAISFTTGHELATSSRDELVVRSDQGHNMARALEEMRLKLFSRSLKLREVSAGGCNACEADTNVLNTVGFDLGRFGIQFVASPRHADGIFVTGPVSENMREALLKTWEAIPEPKIAIVCGACAIGGGPFRGNPEVHDGADKFIPVDLYIPGCPPHPLTILDGLLRLLGKLEK
jgi:Ni,Fe-hydrogenase III small subunit/NAD-dependent dihydropyrimidine dehydrogenase PreA subunit